jgi:hypothetical protein
MSPAIIIQLKITIGRDKRYPNDSNSVRTAVKPNSCRVDLVNASLKSVLENKKLFIRSKITKNRTIKTIYIPIVHSYQFFQMDNEKPTT